MWFWVWVWNLEGLDGGVPADASIGDGDAILELVGLPLDQILPTLIDV